MVRHLLPLIYQYSVMMLIFSIGIYYGVRQGDLGFSTRRQLRNLMVLCGGMALLMGIQTGFQLLTPPDPGQIHGTAGDRVFTRTFHLPRDGGYGEQEGRWIQNVEVEARWFNCPGGESEQVYHITQTLDSGAPGERFSKICPVFDQPLTDWHPELLEHFEEHGFKFPTIDAFQCQKACRREQRIDDRCVVMCLEECSNQNMRILVPPQN